MEFTTHLELHSQATRLCGKLPYAFSSHDGTCTLFGLPFGRKVNENLELAEHPRLQLDASIDYHIELFPLHSPLLRESLLVSFPGLSYMLKFSP